MDQSTFRAYFEDRIKNVRAALALERQRIKSKRNVNTLLVACLAVPSALFFMSKGLNVQLIATIVFSVIVVLIIRGRDNTAEVAFRENVVSILLRYVFGEAVKYRPKGGGLCSPLLERHFWGVKVVFHHEDDYFRTQTNGTDWACCRAKFFKHLSNSTESTKDFFQGFIQKIKIQPFQGTLVLSPKAYHEFRPEAEIQNFDTRFEVFATHPQLPNLLLSVDFKEKLVRLDREWSQSLRYFFVDGWLFLAIPVPHPKYGFLAIDPWKDGFNPAVCEAEVVLLQRLKRTIEVLALGA